MIQRLLIANRGEIAVRSLPTDETGAVYSMIAAQCRMVDQVA